MAPTSALVVILAGVSFLSGSDSRDTASMVPTANAAAGVAGVGRTVSAVRNGLSAPASSVTSSGTTAVGSVRAGSAFGGALGGGMFMFPAIELTPLAAQAIAAPIVGGPTFIHPVPGGEVSPFGPRMHPLLHRPMFHTGIDLAATCGTPIRAAAAGTVIYAEVSASWGLRTIIQHTPTLKTAYGHQSRFLVKEGDIVKQGQIIGLVGTTGWSTGCHLHFDVILNDRYVDPAPYLGFPPSDAKSVPFAVVPHQVFDQSGNVVPTVEDGVPPSQAARATTPLKTAAKAPAGPTSHPIRRPTIPGASTVPETSAGHSTTRPTTPPTTPPATSSAGPTGNPTGIPTVQPSSPPATSSAAPTGTPTGTPTIGPSSPPAAPTSVTPTAYPG